MDKIMYSQITTLEQQKVMRARLATNENVLRNHKFHIESQQKQMQQCKFREQLLRKQINIQNLQIQKQSEQIKQLQQLFITQQTLLKEQAGELAKIIDCDIPKYGPREHPDMVCSFCRENPPLNPYAPYECGSFWGCHK